MRRAVGVVAVGATAALIGAGIGAGTGVAAPHAPSANPTIPKIKVTASKTSFKVSGATTFSTGRVELVLKAVGKERTADIARLKGNYTFKDARSDIKKFAAKDGKGPNGSTPKSALKHLNHLINHVDFYGGLDSLPGQTESGTMVLPKAGSYLLFNDSGNLPKDPTKLTAVGPKVKRAAPKASAHVTALTNRRFGGSKTLPAKGTITFTNKSTESPHFLGLLHVKKGTTKKQLLQEFESNGSGPNYILPGQAGTDTLGEGNSMTLSYKVPAGTYAQICFFPDPKTGMPHAFMGMIRIVTLK